MKQINLSLLVALLLLVGWTDAAAVKPVWQESDAAAANYLKDRKALVGRHCVVNKLVNVVGVGSWVKDLNNLTDEDLTNSATFPRIASATVAVDPITSVRDMDNHYAAGTFAGFTLVAGSDESGLLSLDIVKAFAIGFYLEGELVGTVAVETGGAAGGVGLSLITLPGGSDGNVDVGATAPGEFDEVTIMPAGGVDLTVVKDVKIKYAFVGRGRTLTLTESCMQAYAAECGFDPVTLDQHGWVGSDLINDVLTDGVAGSPVAVGAQLVAQVSAHPAQTDPKCNEQLFKAGSAAGFKYTTASLLKLPVGSSILIQLFKGEWVEKTSVLGQKYWEYEETEVQRETLGTSVLGLNLIKGGLQEASILATEDFSSIKISFITVLSVDLGVIKAYYAFVNPPAEAAHRCDIKLSANTSICDVFSSHQLDFTSSDPDMTVNWTIESQPAGADAQVSETGLVTGMTVSGDYLVRATSAVDGTCYEEVVLTRGIEGADSMCDSPIYNVGAADNTYRLTESLPLGESDALLSINVDVQDPENILNTQFRDYAVYTGGVTLAENIAIVGVKKTNGNFSTGNKHRVGFVVETKSTGLGLNAINLFNIRTYKNGVQTYSAVISESNVISLGLIGSSKLQKMRFAIVVPENVEFDEFVLWKSGVLDVQITKLNLYYAFDEELTDGDDDTVTACLDPLGCSGYLVSPTTSNATLNAGETHNVGVLSVANVINNLSNLIDDDMDTYVSVTNTVTLGGGTVFAIDLGRTYAPTQQVGIITDNNTYLLGAKVAGWLTIETYRNGVATGDSHNDWSVLGANVIGYGDKSFLFMEPEHEYDEIRITIAGVLTALDFQNFYGIFVRNDVDGDGIPDCQDDESCSDELVIDEDATVLAKEHDYNVVDLALHRSMFEGEWNGIVLPVDLTGLQLRNTFGNKVQIAAPDELIIGGGRNKLNFESLEMLDNEVVLHKGEFYLINPERLPDVAAGETYASVHDGEVNGPVYFVKGVNYVRAESELPVEDMSVTESPARYIKSHRAATGGNQEVVLHGTYVALDGTVNEKVPADSYLYSEDNIIPILDHAEEDTVMKGLRFFIEDNTTNDNSFAITVNETPTGITLVGKDLVRTGDGVVYNLHGQRVGRVEQLSQLPAGIYLVNGLKVIVK